MLINDVTVLVAVVTSMLDCVVWDTSNNTESASRSEYGNRWRGASKSPQLAMGSTTEDSGLPFLRGNVDSSGMGADGSPLHFGRHEENTSHEDLSDLEEVFIKLIEWMKVGYNEGRVVFGLYDDQSLKNMTRQKRTTTSTEFLIHPEIKLTMSTKEQEYSSEIQVHLGSHWMNEIDFGKEQQIGVGSVVQHEFYDSTTLENDIAMLKLAEPATSTDYVNIACLPDSTTYYNPGTEGVVVGWGEDNGTSVDNTVLNQVVVPVIDVDICNNTQTMNGTIEDGMFCAGYAEGGKDSCQGDSGGPYQVLRGDGAWELYGVVSWGFGCAEPNSPGVYTHVPTYIDWIYENIAASSNVNVPSLLMLSVMIVWQFW
uniref:Plasminogen-like n=1 Tax=Saccoglossus kowalevskii TaxID=10224 RepID=A0ABM0MZQ8_SACKO|nr:PREDICTED: plasminogen-like [Saccoglossus kowalevskii]